MIDHDSTLAVQLLSQKIETDLPFMGTGVPKFEIDSELWTNIHIELPRSWLPVLLRHVRVYVTSYEMQVVLFGRDLLDKLAFNFEKYLAHNYSEVKEVDCSADEKGRSKGIVATVV